MTKREAKAWAHKQVWAVLQSHLDNGCEFELEPGGEDVKKVSAAVKKIAESHLARWLRAKAEGRTK